MIPLLHPFNEDRIFDVKPRPQIAVFLVVVAIIGCSGGRKTDYDSLNLVQVSGKVTLDDQPLSGVSVVFEDENGNFSFGITDESGEYELIFNSEQTGVTPGNKIVRIRYGGVGEGEEEEDPDSTEKTKTPPVSIPARYNSKSEFKVEVKEGARTFNFALKSKP